MKVFDDDDREVAAGALGEIVLRGEQDEMAIVALFERELTDAIEEIRALRVANAPVEKVSTPSEL